MKTATKTATAQEAKPGLVKKTKTFFSQVKTETAKVVWPTKEQVKTYAIVVLTASIIVAILMGIWDLMITRVMEVIFSITS